MPYVKEVFIFICIVLPFSILAQGVTKYTYYDVEKKTIKEIYQIKSDKNHQLQGEYLSYFRNGKVASKGQFINNLAEGIWEFYFESGNIKMRGLMKQNISCGSWEYFSENGKKNMEGVLEGKVKNGIWKFYYENGKLRETGIYWNNKREGLWNAFYEDSVKLGEYKYTEDFGHCKEYYRSGKLKGEGTKKAGKHEGIWHFFFEQGTLESEGMYVNNMKTGEWKKFFPSGKILAKGKYENDKPIGTWTYYYEDGKVNSLGEYINGVKNGYWITYQTDGHKNSETVYQNGVGEYREYYQDGKIKITGNIQDDLNQGTWRYYYEDGKVKGECDFIKGKGMYKGYYPSGVLQTKGEMKNNQRIGTWELYENDGELTGYYKAFYEDDQITKEVDRLLSDKKNKDLNKAKDYSGGRYFSPQYAKVQGVILATNPFFTLLGFIPLTIEFYNPEKLCHEFEFINLRDPFFTADSRIPENHIYVRGYSISAKQKFYNSIRSSKWYFGHQIQFSQKSYFSNIASPISPLSKLVANASEINAEYGMLVGLRLMQQNYGNGFTIDSFIGYNIGYRSFDVEPTFQYTFEKLNQSVFSNHFIFGLNFGYFFSVAENK